MKKLSTLLFLLPFFTNAQTVTSVAAGNFYTPATWDCTCVPNATDTIYVNHAVTLNLGISYSGGLLQVGGAGSLIDGGAGFGILINGGNVTNIGTINCSAILLESGYFNNIAQLYVDSLRTKDTASNLGIINITENFRNDADGNFINWGTVTVGNDFLNEAVFCNNSTLNVHHNFANCNMASSEATLDISGEMCVYNDFLNCVDDTILGNGTIYITGSSNNAGEMQGNFIVNTLSGALSVNTGNIAGGVSFGTGSCDAGIVNEINKWSIYPNPAENFLICSEQNIHFEIYDFTGRIISSAFSADGNINVESLSTGVYTIRIASVSGLTQTELFQKN